MKPIIVLGGGWSAKEYLQAPQPLLRERGTVIGVNDAAIHARVDIAITMDRLWLENRRETLEFLAIPVHYREGVCKNCAPPTIGIPFKCNNRMDEGMTLEPNALYGNNSGAVALNLAYKLAQNPHIGAKQVYLLGFDMMNGPNGEKHWYPPYPWNSGGGSSDGKLKAWSAEFALFAQDFQGAGIDVKNVTTRSALNNWKRISFAQFEKETENG